MICHTLRQRAIPVDGFVSPGNTDADIREGDRGVPCVIFVHGGGWKGGDKKSAKQNAAWLVEHGFAVASINYRLTDVARCQRRSMTVTKQYDGAYARA